MTLTAMSLTERLILGTARLTGGASERDALTLVRAALDAGIRHIDTAPSYGMGTAEIVVGKALRGFGGPVAITAKLGSARDPQALAKSWLRRARRAVAGGRGSVWDSTMPATLAEPSGHDFRREAMQASLELSCERLGQIDYLLLHDVTRPEVTTEMLADLGALATRVSAASGYAIRTPWQAKLAAAFAPGSIAQCAASWAGSAPATSGALFLHSIVKAGAAHRAQSPAFAARLDAAARMIGTGDRDADRIASLYAAAGSAAPRARLVIASSYRERLLAVLRSIAAIASADEIAAVLAE